jgi:hypothetical protein
MLLKNKILSHSFASFSGRFLAYFYLLIVAVFFFHSHDLMPSWGVPLGAPVNTIVQHFGPTDHASYAIGAYVLKNVRIRGYIRVWTHNLTQ